MFIFGYAKALKEANEENEKLKIELNKAYTDIFNLQADNDALTEKVNKQKQELKNSTYKWK